MDCLFIITFLYTFKTLVWRILGLRSQSSQLMRNLSESSAAIPRADQIGRCPPLAGDDIWIKVLPQKRYTLHIDGCDVWHDLRPFLKCLVHPFSSKLRSKEAEGLKSGNLGKQNFFLYINFLLDSILFLCTMVKFHLKVA